MAGQRDTRTALSEDSSEEEKICHCDSVSFARIDKRRRDLLLKTLNRSVKRFLSIEFKVQYQISSSKNYKANGRAYRDNIMDFVSQIIEKWRLMTKLEQVEDVTLEEIRYFLCFLSSSVHYKKLPSKPRSHSKTEKLYNDSIYKYTKGNASRLLMNSIYRVVFRGFVDSGDFKRFVDTDETLGRDRRLVMEALDFKLKMMEIN